MQAFCWQLAQNLSLAELYFPAKAEPFQSFLNSSIIFEKFLCLKSTILGKLRQPRFAKQKKMKFLIRTGVFLGCFEKLKKKENLQTSVSSRDKKETKILQYVQSRNFKAHLTSIKQPPNKTNSKFLHKNRAHLLWVPTLMIWLRVDKEFRFTIVALSTTPNLF